MDWPRFHHPDYCAEVILRGVAQDLLMMAGYWGRVFATRGRAAPWRLPDAEYWSYQSAMGRLRRQGLIAYRRTRGRPPELRLLARGQSRLPVEAHPEKLWRQKWNGIWYALSYDVPESRRAYRETLRAFLREQRMGCLHRSFWITPRDIRPLYADLCEAGGVDNYAMLVEARTVLGLDPQRVVNQAWGMDRLAAAQQWYIATASAILSEVEGKALHRSALLLLARQECGAYLRVMSDDPLLPSALWPPGYRGPDAVAAHRRFQRRMARMA